jgi:hypothetical protein
VFNDYNFLHFTFYVLSMGKGTLFSVVNFKEKQILCHVQDFCARNCELNKLIISNNLVLKQGDPQFRFCT